VPICPNGTALNRFLLMNKQSKLSELKRLQTKVDLIRSELQISVPGKILSFHTVDASADDRILVEADGFGGATTRMIEGNYPIDFCTKYEKHFRSEKAAELAAEHLLKHQLKCV